MDIKPIADRQNVFVTELGGETVIYMKRFHRAARLDSEAARIWLLCDGEHELDEIASASPDLSARDVAAIVARLGDAGLLANVDPAPAAANDDDRPDFGRRNAIFKLAGTAVAVGAVAMIPVPAAAQAASCLANGAFCTSPAQCCSGICFAMVGVCEPSGV